MIAPITSFRGTDSYRDNGSSRPWTRRLAAAIAADALNGTCLNFSSPDGAADLTLRRRTGYGANSDRLVAVKRRYDPTNPFRENNTVAP